VRDTKVDLLSNIIADQTIITDIKDLVLRYMQGHMDGQELEKQFIELLDSITVSE